VRNVYSALTVIIWNALDMLVERKVMFNVQLGNERTSRVASRFGDEFVNALNMLLLTLPGTALTYYGEELGMVDSPSTVSDIRCSFDSSVLWCRTCQKTGIIAPPPLLNSLLNSDLSENFLPIGKFSSEIAKFGVEYLHVGKILLRN